MRATDIRAKARRALSGRWFVAAIAGIIATMFGAASGFTLNFNFDFDSLDLGGSTEGLSSFAPQLDPDITIPVLIGAGVAMLVYVAIMFVLACVISVGYAEFNLDLVDRYTPRIRTLFSHFGQTKTAVVAALMIFVRVLIGTIFFIIPGIIAAYKYFAVYYIIAENPYISAKEALEKSKEVMWHNKWRAFCLDLSFIGWDLLSALTLGIASIWITPYRQTAHAIFYRQIMKEQEEAYW